MPPRGRPKKDSAPIKVRMEQDLIQKVEEWRDKFAPEEKSLPATIRRMLTEYLRHCGLIKPEK